jgi:hypothetical protein
MEPLHSLSTWWEHNTSEVALLLIIPICKICGNMVFLSIPAYGKNKKFSPRNLPYSHTPLGIPLFYAS